MRPLPRKVSLAVAGAMVLSGLITLDAAAAGPQNTPVKPNVQETPSVPGAPVTSKPAPPPGESLRNTWTGAPNSVWPAAGSGEVDLATTVPPTSGARAQEADRPAPAPGTQVKVGSLPVKVSLNGDAAPSTGTTATSANASGADAANTASKLRVDIGDRAAAQRVGVDGVVLGVKRVDGTPTSTPVTVELDYSSFKGMYGGDWSSRLQFVGLPACALTTPERPECRTQTPVQFRNDAAASTLTAKIDAAGASPTGTQDRAAAVAPTGGIVLAAVAASEGPKGDYKATTLAPSGSWQGGGPAGDFSWSYPLELPTSLGGPGPNLALGYSSSSVDGRTSASQAQTSWVGDGWDMGGSYIERTFPSCADDKKPGSGFNNPEADTGDVCQGPPVVAMSLNGGSTQLVLNDDPNNRVWRPQSDDGSTVELLRGAPNGDKEGEYWVVTTMDGTKYYFGQNQLPGWAAGKPVTKSAWTMPVVGNHPGEDCYNTSFANSFCDQVYRWNLDLVVDPRGNAMSHYYETELNSYGSNVQTDGTSTNRQYVRGGWLTRSEYGLRSDNLYAAAPAWVDFTVTERCLPLAGVNCAPEALNKDTAKNWPDVPFDQNCNVGENCKDRYAPTFWSRKRLVDITTRIRVGGQVRDVDTWILTHDFPAAGDGSDRALWLASIQRIGKNGTTPGISMPPVQFMGKQLPNRVDNNGDGSPPYFRYRIDAIHTETGQSIGVTYLPTECSTVAPVNLPAPESNGKRCYPVRQELRNPSDPDAPPTYKLDWFHKHVVTQIRDEDRNGNSPSKVTNYEYVGTPAWAFEDDNELVKPELRTWSQWRGYERIRTRTGNPDEDLPSLVENLYFRGMDGDKQPSGTRSVEIVDSEGGKIRDTELFNGQVRETLYYNGDGGPLMSATVFTPWLSEPTASRAREGMAPQEARFQQTVKVTSRTALSDNRGWRRTETQNTFDSRGLQLTNNNLGDLATAADDSCTRITYGPIADKHILNLVSRVETVAKLCDAPAVRPDDVVSDQLAYYDAVGNSTGGAALDRYEGTTPKYESNGTVTVDNYGRPKVTTDIYGVTTTNTYFPAAGEIVAKIESVNSLGHKTTIEVDPARGVPLVETDTNGRKTVMQYDALGRMTKVWSPDRDPNSMSPDAEFSYTVRTDGPVVTTTKKLNNKGEYFTSYDIFDGMLRLRQTQMPAHGGNGRIISDTFYNTRGEIWKENAAHWNSDSGPVGALWASADNKVPASTVTEYDGLGRPVATVARKDGVEQRRTTTTYGGDWIAVDPPKGTTPTKAYVDALGRKTELQQFKGEGPTGTEFDKTRYEYDRRGQLSKVIDPTGLEWTYEYDLRGRLVKTIDPDRGTTTQTYDKGSRLLTTTDGRGKTIAYAYDILGRPTTTHEGTLQGPKLTEQTYDTLPGAIGLPVSSSRFVNGNEYKQEVTAYDTEYRPTGTKITIPAIEGKLAGTYQFGSGYGITGLPAWVSHPAAGGLTFERVATEYDSYDLPTLMTVAGATFVPEVVYNPLGQVSYTRTGPLSKQITSSYEYDAHSGRTTRVTNDRDTAPGRINDIRYTYDESGNILQISDAEGVNPTASTTDTQCFVYDYVQRMTDAWSATDSCAAQPGATGTNGGKPMVGGPNPYWTSYTYGTTGNRLTEIQHDPAGITSADVTRTYAYPQTGTKTHQLSSVTTTGPGGSRVESFLYDEVGNTTSRTVGGDTQILDWNAEGRLDKATTAGKPTEFIYDASGARLIRRDPDSTTLYLPGTELKLTKATNKVTGTRTYSHPAGPALVRSNETGSIKNSYLLADHNGTANTSLDASTQAITRRKSTPFGDARGTQPSVWPNEQGYVGGTIDKSTSLVHLGAREYDPTIGRFLSVDPIMDNTDPQSMQAYNYANNSPVTLSDPDGLCARPVGNRCRGGGDDTPSRVQQVESKYNPPAPPQNTGPSQADLDRARFLANQSKMDYAAQVAKEVLKDMSGYNDIMSCVGGSYKSCAMLAIEAAMWFAGKAKKIYKAYKKIKNAIEKWGEQVTWARGIVRQADDAAAVQARYADDLAAYNRKYDEDLAAARKADDDAAAAAAAAKKSEEEAAAAAKADAAGDADAPGSSPGATCHSFLPGTYVLMADGSHKQLSEIQLGDQVITTDTDTNTTTIRPVVGIIVTETDKDFVDLTVATTDTEGKPTTSNIVATTTHPFWVPDLKEWVEAGDLVSGQWLQTSSGTWVQLTATTYFRQQQQTYDLTIEDIHAYHVLAGSAPLLVHNTNAGNPLVCSVMGETRQAADVESTVRPQEMRASVVEGIQLPTGQTYVSPSIRGDTPIAHHPLVQSMLDAVPVGARGRGHGRCGLAACLSQALNDGLSPSNSMAAAFVVRSSTDHPRHGIPAQACRSCEVLSQRFGLFWTT
ncbi:RHS repeat-associated core domain-containing protein [Yinghuangia sp. YIM S09857]|uniref:RHS repeat-associated core domain-containing protein n=1 Tax=Yinghuangia sp. YIM S09857 TaxID=3436929 RepID=UPI003F5338AC